MMSNSAGESGGDDNGSDGKKGGKRELSTSKRAAQNRAAQVRFTCVLLGTFGDGRKVGDYNVMQRTSAIVFFQVRMTKTTQLTNT